MLPPTFLGHCIERLPCMRMIRSAPLDSCILQPGPQLRGHNQIVELMAWKPCLVRAWSIRWIVGMRHNVLEAFRKQRGQCRAIRRVVEVTSQ